MRVNLLIAALAAVTAANAIAAPSAAPEMMQGGNLFIITCSSSFCHGEGGVGAQGPSLKNRNFTPDFVRNTVTNGRSGTPMPAFKDTLSQAELSMIVDFVMSLSPNNHNMDAAAVAPAAPTAPPPPPMSAKAQAGQAIFFDLSRPGACAACHSYREQGGPIGPDLKGVAKRTPRDIYQAMVNPGFFNQDYPAVEINTANGTPNLKKVYGIQKQTNGKVMQFYDLSSVPPVLRTVYDVGFARPTPPDMLLYTHDVSDLSKDNLAALITFLKSADAASKDVTPQDVAQP
jgi:mono/diheme cytochrome c family protein